MNAEDAILTNAAIDASIYLGKDVPLSELMRKQAFYKSFQAFSSAIMADPALIKTEVVHKLKDFDRLYGIHRSEAESDRHYKFTQGDYRRFCSMFFLLTRNLL
jgi:hypothetical protein